MSIVEKMQIMIIDDIVANVNLARMALEQEYDVLLISYGEKALKLLNGVTSDLILLDV